MAGWVVICTVQASPETIDHTYANPGTYTVILTAINLAGSGVATNTVTVYEPVKAGFTASPRHGAAPLTVHFTDVSSGPVAS